MPIHFTCHSCHRRLSVGSHKAGSDAQCPKCQAIIHVPTREESLSRSAMIGVSSSPTEVDARDIFDFDFDDGPLNVRVPASSPTSSSTGSTTSLGKSGAIPAPGLSFAAGGVTTADLDFDADRVSISRRTLYAQGFLIAAIALFAFVAGYLVGDGGAPPEVDARHAAPVGGPLHLTGQITFEPSIGNRIGDAGAVIIVLPAETSPDEKLSAIGLRPQDAMPADQAPSVLAIESLGGAYVRADAEGKFAIELVRPGKYHVLRLSSATVWADGFQHRPEVLATLDQFFTSASELLDRKKYNCETLDVSAASTELNHNFGASGK